ncbi:SBBP repeat-containing protein, partial [bacterium]|nr:SBBP repeat-containing protein [bacterium]
QTWGSSGHDYGTGVVADSPGNSYVVGDFNGVVDFDTSSGTDIHSSNGLTDVFLVKYNPYGTW